MDGLGGGGELNRIFLKAAWDISMDSSIIRIIPGFPDFGTGFDDPDFRRASRHRNTWNTRRCCHEMGERVTGIVATILRLL